MRHTFPHPVREQQGFTLIEILVVVLIVGILAAIAIPTFFSQTSKANNASAKSLAQTAEVAMAASASDHNGSYTAITNPAALNSVEPSIPIAAANNEAYLSAASGNATGYSLTVIAYQTASTFTVTDTNGAITRACSGTGNGCVGGSW